MLQVSLKGECKGGWHMRPRKIIAMVMTFLMMLSLLPSLVFAAAAPEGELGGQLKIKGTAAVGSELSADYEKVTPKDLQTIM